MYKVIFPDYLIFFRQSNNFPTKFHCEHKYRNRIRAYNDLHFQSYDFVWPSESRRILWVNIFVTTGGNNKPDKMNTVMMKILLERWHLLRTEIEEAERQFGRIPGSVKLLAVSKTRDVADILSLAQLGVTDFGENYVQEAREKIEQLSGHSLCWHFIGPIQSNKTRQLAGCFDWVHSVDRIKIASRLNAARPPDMPPLNICIQVNIDAESSKSGVEPGGVQQLAEQVLPLTRLKLRGLMGMPAPVDDFATQRHAFMKLRHLQEQLIDRGFQLDTLSMGTTNDMRAAIAEGATIIRIGTALFGPRSR